MQFGPNMSKLRKKVVIHDNVNLIDLDGGDHQEVRGTNCQEVRSSNVKKVPQVSAR